MFKILAKTTVDNKIINSYVFECSDDFEIDNFNDYVNSICYELDMPNPVILIKHIKNFILFNYTTFFQEDFIEKVFFEKFVLEYMKI